MKKMNFKEFTTILESFWSDKFGSATKLTQRLCRGKPPMMTLVALEVANSRKTMKRKSENFSLFAVAEKDPH